MRTNLLILLFMFWLYIAVFILSGPKLLKLEVGDCFSDIKEESWEKEEPKLVLEVGKTKYRVAFWFNKYKQFVTDPQYTLTYNKSSINNDQYKKVDCSKESVK